MHIPSCMPAHQTRPGPRRQTRHPPTTQGPPPSCHPSSVAHIPDSPRTNVFVLVGLRSQSKTNGNSTCGNHSGLFYPPHYCTRAAVCAFSAGLQEPDFGTARGIFRLLLTTEPGASARSRPPSRGCACPRHLPRGLGLSHPFFASQRHQPA